MKSGADIEPLLSYFKAFHNPATGLPRPIDLVDLNTTIPKGFNKGSVEEIEALLIKTHQLKRIRYLTTSPTLILRKKRIRSS